MTQPTTPQLPPWQKAAWEAAVEMKRSCLRAFDAKATQGASIADIRTAVDWASLDFDSIIAKHAAAASSGAEAQGELPWRTGLLVDRAIVGMNHYHVKGERRLFVAMTKDCRCITGEGADEAQVFEALETAALQESLAATSSPRPAPTETICWHCSVVLATKARPRCENCPDECDIENCDADGCQPSAFSRVEQPPLPATNLDEALVDYMKEARLSHLHWAEHFEARPELEKQYAETGEWDTAEVHRKWVAIYDDVIARLASSARPKRVDEGVKHP